VIDLAPTILALLGLPGLPDADGRALVESFASNEEAPPAITTEPIATVASGPLRRHRVGTTAYLDTTTEE
jgi:arylsulfatase A-like enzyme